jgi:NAD(P)-dependent dehydrogenase (short-subunit alcohol dehydrogenase family)
VLVNNAGITRDRMFLKMTREDWDAVIETNLNSMFNVTKQVVGDMVEKGWGRIINISSVNGEKGQAGQTNYSAAKAGMHGFTMALAQELANKGVTVNTVSPGYIGTDMVKAIRQDVLDKIVATIPVKRLGEPERDRVDHRLAGRRGKRLLHRRRLLGQRRPAHGLAAPKGGWRAARRRMASGSTRPAVASRAARNGCRSPHRNSACCAGCSRGRATCSRATNCWTRARPPTARAPRGRSTAT